MDSSNQLICPECHSKSLVAKYKATYVYSYIIDSNAPGLKNQDEFLPFLFDNRRVIQSNQYIECSVCGAQYECTFSEGNKGIDFTILQKAVRSDYVNNPEFLG